MGLRPTLLITLLTGSLYLAACDAVRTPEPTRIPLDGAVAAMVNGEPLYLADIELEATAQGLIVPGEAFGLGHPSYQLVLDQMIDQRLMAQEAIGKGLDMSGMASRRLRVARERVLGNLLVEDLVARHVTEERIREMYAEQVSLQQIDDEVRIRHILLETEAEAASARTRVMEGEDFTAVAFDVSIDTATRIEGGELGYVAPGLMGEPFSSQIGNTAVGDMSAPFESDQGWHIIKVEDRRTPAPKTLEEMRIEIVTFLTYAEISEILKSLRQEAVIAPGRDVPTLTPEDLDSSQTGDAP